jgi:hypothetical protein
LDAKVDVELDSLHVKKIAIKDLVCYVYIVSVTPKKILEKGSGVDQNLTF